MNSWQPTNQQKRERNKIFGGKKSFRLFFQGPCFLGACLVFICNKMISFSSLHHRLVPTIPTSTDNTKHCAHFAPLFVIWAPFFVIWTPFFVIFAPFFVIFAPFFVIFAPFFVIFAPFFNFRAIVQFSRHFSIFAPFL
jgi:hypothetical protein